MFVADTARKFNMGDVIRPVLTHRHLGVGVTLRAGGLAQRYKTLPYAAIAETIRTESLSEEMRILYVALTRARDALAEALAAVDGGFGLDAVAVCLADAQQALADLAGEDAAAATLDAVFADFCVGK